MLSELGRLIEQVSKDKSIDKQVVTNAVAQGLLSALRKRYGTYRDIEVKYNEEENDFEIFEFKLVVEDDKFIDDQIEIKYSEAIQLDPEVQVNDQIGIKLGTEELGRIDAGAAQQIIAQSLRNAEYEVIFSEFEKRKGEVVNGVVRRVERGSVVVDLEKTEAYIPRKEQIYGEKYTPGDRIQGYILEVEQNTRGPKIIMSRAHPQYLIKLFEAEVPEIQEGVIKIKTAAREAGHRAKVAVYSLDSSIHPVGACVGMKGNRVQNITQELKGERIDVVIWDSNPVQFVCNALAPAKISKVFVDEESREMEVVVPDDQLSLAIGKKGQNVRLAVQLTEWKLNIMSEQDYETKRRESLFNLCLLPNINETLAQSLFQSGVNSLTELAMLSLEKAKTIAGLEKQEVAESLIREARQMVEEYRAQNKEFEKPPTLEEELKEKKQIGAQAQADMRLKREMERLEEGSSSEGTAPTKEAVEATESEKDTTEVLESVKEEAATPEAELTSKEKQDSNEEIKTEEAPAEEKAVAPETKSESSEETSREAEDSSAEEKEDETTLNKEQDKKESSSN